MRIMTIGNVRDQRDGTAVRRIRQAAFVVLCSGLFVSALYAGRAVERLQETVVANTWVVPASVVPLQTPAGIDSMFRR